MIVTFSLLNLKLVLKNFQKLSSCGLSLIPSVFTQFLKNELLYIVQKKKFNFYTLLFEVAYCVSV